MVALDFDVAGRADLRLHGPVLFQALHEHRCPAVNEAFRQAFVQRVGEFVLDRAGARLPVNRVGEPAGLVRHIGPCPDLRDAVRQRIDLAVGAVGAPHLFGHEGLVDMAVAHKVDEDRRDDVGMLRRRDLAIVRKGAHLPQALDGRRAGAKPGDGRVAGQEVERALVDRRQRPRQARQGGHVVERCLERGDRAEVEPPVAPLQDPQRRELVPLDPADELVVERRHPGRDAERAVAHVPARPPGDLGHLGRRQIAKGVAVELAQLGERDVIDVKVQAHADRVGGDQIVDVAGLEQRHLRVARARAERAHHHRRAAALAANQLGDGVHLIGRKGDDRRPARQPGQLGRTGIGQMRHSGSRRDVDARQQTAQQRFDGRRAQQERLFPAAHVQEPVGEDVAALQIAGKLHLVDGDEGGIGLARHRLDRAHGKARPFGDDLLLAGHQRDAVRPHLLRHPAIDLARQKPQRQADHARRMGDHAFDRQMRLAGVGRAEDGRHAMAGRRRRGLTVG